MVIMPRNDNLMTRNEAIVSTKRKLLTYLRLIRRDAVDIELAEAAIDEEKRLCRELEKLEPTPPQHGPLTHAAA